MKRLQLGIGVVVMLRRLVWMIGENSRAISTLTRLLQTPYYGGFYGPTPVTLALLRLDPIWDPLRGDPRFEKIVALLAPQKR